MLPSAGSGENVANRESARRHAARAPVSRMAGMERVAREIAPGTESAPLQESAEQGLAGNEQTVASLAGNTGADVVFRAAAALRVEGVSPSPSNASRQAAMRAAEAYDRGEIDGPALVEQSLRRGGTPLPAVVLHKLEAWFGRDLSMVRVHDDALAHDAARGVSARAFTVGTHIAFGAGELRPGTTGGDELLAHEVTHAVQHLEGRHAQPSGVENGMPVTMPGDAVEREAESVGADFARAGGALAAAGPDVMATEAVVAEAPGMSSGASGGAIARDVLPDGDKGKTDDTNPDKDTDPKDQADKDQDAKDGAKDEEEEKEKDADGGATDKDEKDGAKEKKGDEDEKDEEGKDEKDKDKDKDADETDEDESTDADADALLAADADGGGDEDADTTGGGSSLDGGGGPGIVSPPPSFDPLPRVRLDTPRLDKEKAAQIKKDTGLGIDEHVTRINTAGDELTRIAGGYQSELVTRVETLEESVTTAVTTQVGSLDGAAATAKEQITAAFAGARTALDEVSGASAADVHAAAATANTDLEALSVTWKATIATEFDGAKGKLDALRATMEQPYLDVFSTKVEECKKLGAKNGKLAVEEGKRLSTQFKASYGGDAYGDLQLKCKAEAAVKAGEKRQQSLVAEANNRAGKIAMQALTVKVLVNGTVDPLVKELEARRKLAEEKLDATLEAARTKIKTEDEGADKTIEDLRANGGKRVEDGATKGTTAVDTARTKAATSLQEQGDQAKSGLRDTAKALGDTYAGFVQQFDAAITPMKKEPNWEQVRPQAESIRKDMDEAHATNLKSLDEQAVEAAKGLEKSAVTSATELAGVGTTESQAGILLAEELRTSTQKHTDAIKAAVSGLGDQFKVEIAGFAGPLTEKAKTAEADAKIALDAQKKGFEDALTEQLKAFDAELAQKAVDISAMIEGPAGALYAAAKEKLEGKATNLWDAMDGMGTSEGAIMTALRGIDKVEAAALKKIYAEHYRGKSIEAHLRSEMEGGDLSEALAHLSGDRVSATFAALSNGISWYGDDEAAIEAQLRLLSDEELAELQKQAKDDPTKAAIIQRVRDNLGSHDLDVTNALLDTSIDEKTRNLKADAIRVHEAIDGWGTDEDAVFGKLEGKSKEEMAQLEALYKGYATTKATEDNYGIKPEGDFSLRTAIDGDMDDAQQDLGFALLDDDKIGQKAAKLELAATDGWFFGGGTDEKKIFDQLKDPNLKQPDPKDPDYDAKMVVYKKAVEDRAALEKRYADKYGRSISTMLDAEMGKADDTNYERQVADQYQKKGTADDELVLKYATDGWGTNEDMLKETLQGKSKAEIATLRSKYAAKYGGPNAPADLLDQDLGIGKYAGFGSELSGKEQLDVDIAMMGTPTTPEEYQAILDKKHEWQRGGASGAWMDFMGAIGVSEGAEQLDWQKAKADKAVDDWKSGGQSAEKDKENVELLFGRYNSDFESYERVKGEVADGVVTGIEIVGAVVLTVLTDGAASPLLVAVLGTLATGATAMTARALMTGNSYGWEAATTDGVKNILAAATAGLGNAKFVENWAKGLVKNVPPGVIQSMLNEGLKNLPGNILDSIAGVMLDEKNWDNDLVAQKMLFSILAASGSSMASGEIKKLLGDKPTFLGQALSSGTTALAGDVTSKLLNPDTYNGDSDDVFWKVVKSGGGAFAKGSLSGIATRSVRAKNLADKVNGGTVTAAQLEAEHGHLSAEEKAYIASRLSNPSNLPAGWKKEIVTWAMVKDLESTLGTNVDAGAVKQPTPVVQTVDADGESKDKTTADTDTPQTRTTTETTPTPTTQATDAASSKVSGASQADLEAINGIGPVKAKAIRDWIATNGPVTSLDDLANVPGIGPATLAKIKEHYAEGATDVRSAS